MIFIDLIFLFNIWIIFDQMIYQAQLFVLFDGSSSTLYRLSLLNFDFLVLSSQLTFNSSA